MFFIASNIHFSYSDLLDMEHSEFIEWIKLTKEYIDSVKKSFKR